MKFYPHHIGDYRSATAYLSNEEDICYRRLLEIYYDTERPIIPDTRLLSRQTRVSQAVVEDILQEFFTFIDGFWHNGRADGEISRWYSKSASAKANIEKRWEKNKKHTDVLRTNNKRNTESYQHDTTQDPRPNTQDLTSTPIVNPDGLTPVDKPKNGLNCPHQKLLELYHVECHSLARVARWSESRKKAMATLWKLVCHEEKFTTEQQGLEYFEGYFNWIEQSDFLCGRTGGDRPFLATIDWILKPANFTKIIESNYHRRAA